MEVLGEPAGDSGRCGYLPQEGRQMGCAIEMTRWTRSGQRHQCVGQQKLLSLSSRYNDSH